MRKLLNIWNWPDGTAWRWLLATGKRLRDQRFKWFMTQFAPEQTTRVLDVGVTAESAGTSNFFEKKYPFPQSLTACGVENKPAICQQLGIEFVQADGRELPFDDASFDIAHSNAVIEHVGSRDQQSRFVAELCRVAKRVYISTPNKLSPIETHTLIPCAHWLPRRACWWIYRKLGREYYASQDTLNLISASQLVKLFPENLRTQVKIKRQFLWGMPVIITAWLDRE